MEEGSIFQKIIARTLSGLSDRPEFDAKTIKALKQIADEGQLSKADLIRTAITQEGSDETATTDNPEH